MVGAGSPGISVDSHCHLVARQRTPLKSRGYTAPAHQLCCLVSPLVSARHMHLHNTSLRVPPKDQFSKQKPAIPPRPLGI